MTIYKISQIAYVNGPFGCSEVRVGMFTMIRWRESEERLNFC